MDSSVRGVLADADQRKERLTVEIRGLDAEVSRLQANRKERATELEKLQIVIDYLRQQAGEPVLAPQTAAHPPSGALSGLPVPEATIRWLREVGPPYRDTNEVVAALDAGGVASAAEDRYSATYGSLHRAASRPNGPLIKQNGKWGLREWGGGD